MQKGLQRSPARARTYANLRKKPGNRSLVREAMEVSALCWRLETVLNDLPALSAWPLPSCNRQIHIHAKTSEFFAPNSHWRSQQKSSSIFPLGRSLVSHPSFCGSLLWILPTSFLPAFFFFFLPEENSFLISGP